MSLIHSKVSFLFVSICIVFQLVAASPITLTPRQAPAGNNNYACRSSKHPNPVIMLHGLLASEDDDLNVMEGWLIQQGFCTFALTYGAYPLFPYVGGLKAISSTSGDIANFIRQVQSSTGAAKVDIVGHSEGAFQALYVPKVDGLGSMVDKIVAIAPPTHGSTLDNLYNVVAAGGPVSVALAEEALDVIGCDACTDLTPVGPAVERLNDGTPIVQPGNNVLIIASRHDEVVTPPQTAFVYENGVQNVWVQDACPNDPVGHAGLPLDQNVWYRVANHLDSSIAIPSKCYAGLPV